MQAFDPICELRNDKRDNTGIDYRMSENSSTEGSPVFKPAEQTENLMSEIRAVTQEKVDEQINGFIAPLTRQPEQLTRLV